MSFAKLTCLGLIFLSSSISASAVTGLLTDGSTSSHQLIEEGDKLVYIIDGETNFQQDLFVKEVRGNLEIKLSEGLGAQGVVSSFQISPDESMVVYAGATSDGGLKELYSTPVLGGASVKLSVNINGPSERLGSIRITPDSRHVVYSVVRGGVLKTLYIVPIGGGNSLQLGVESEFIGIGKITSDSKFAIFIGGEFGVTYARNLYRIDLSDGSVVQLSNDLIGDGFPDFPVLSPDGQSVIYDSFSTIASEQGLFVAPLSGGSPMRLTSVSSLGANKLFGVDGEVVYFIGDPGMTGQRQLLSVPLVGGSVDQVVSNLGAGENVDLNAPHQISSDGSFIVFFVGDVTQRNLYSVDLSTGLAAKLNPQGRVIAAEVSDDGIYVVFKGDSETPDLFELFSVPISGGVAVKLNVDYSDTSNTTSGINLDISPDSKRVSYWIDIDGDFKNEIFEVAITGGQSERLSPDLPSDANPSFPRYSDDSSLVVFTISEFEGVFNGVYAFDFRAETEDFCFPISASNGRTVLVCL